MNTCTILTASAPNTEELLWVFRRPNVNTIVVVHR